ncbi:MAG: hypothetical protein JWO36_6936 [Myxococcales bacterium]|nr:hypothetical protein [Myxococcales bacterium]
MQYLMLIYVDEKKFSQMAPADMSKMLGEYMELNKELKASGKLLGGNRLQPTATAATVRVREGKPQSTDGPFAETREQLGGYFLIEAQSLEEAKQIAARIPGARHGSIEVRPVNPM